VAIIDEAEQVFVRRLPKSFSFIRFAGACHVVFAAVRRDDKESDP
jgi:hypothetical protein